MANQTEQDLSVNNEPDERRATFVRPTGEHDQPTVPPHGRRASFRAPAQTSRGLEVVRAFMEGASRDAAESVDAPARGAASYAAALAEEALGDNDRAATRLTRMRREGVMTPAAWAAYRRVIARLAGQDGEEVFDTLVSAARDAEGDVDRNLLALEVAREAWRTGRPAGDIRAWETQLAPDPYDGPFTHLTAALLDVDVALDQGDVRSAIEALAHIANDVRLAPHVRCDAEVCRALFFVAIGKTDDALAAFENAARRHHLRNDVRETFVSLAAKAHRPDLVRVAGEGARLSAESKLVVASFARDAASASAIARVVLEETPDDIFAIERAVDWAEIDGETSTELLIDALNGRLESELDDVTRIATLCRLGRVYERKAGLEEAAAEIYREALELDGSYAPALRALGRIYNRRSNWTGLAELYEQEIEALGDAGGVWRRHFQAAEIYAIRLGDGENALRHYRAVLAARPGYLPALKGAARIHEERSQWAELADLFLEAAASASTGRQKLYLLDKVAEVAEVHLHDVDIAIGAWEEILHIAPDHPKAFAALGRLLAGAQRWKDLVALNERELAHIEDTEEAVALLVRNAEITATFLADDRGAESWYRRALELVPDYLPALEGLGRIFVRGGRWDDVVDMTGAQIHATRDVREVLRQLGALAEIFESQLGLDEQAARIYQNILDVSPNDPCALDALTRYAESVGDWDRAADLRRRSLEEVATVSSVVRAETTNAHMFEFRANRFDEAYACWLRALEASPANLHALRGAVRCADHAGVGADQLASLLEDLMVRLTDAASRDAYFLAVARLREEAEGTPEASRAYRALGDAENVENRIILSCAMGLAGERSAIEARRRSESDTSLDQVAGAYLSGNTDADREGLAIALEAADHAERAWLLTSAAPTLASKFVRAGDPAAARLGAELARVTTGEEMADEPADAHGLRLRALACKADGDWEGHVLFTAREVGAGIAPETKVSRWLECAHNAPQDEALAFVRSAVTVAFDEQVEVADGPAIDRLYDTLQALEAWEDARDALCAHIARANLNEARRLMLLTMLAEILEDALLDLDGAQFVWEAAWHASDSAEHLEDIVRAASARGDIETAVDVQQLRFERAIDDGESVDARIETGMRLAELLEMSGEGASAIHVLEELLHPKVEGPVYQQLQRRLARLHVEHGDARRAANIFETVLPFEANESVASDWRMLISLYEERLDEPMTAFGLHWKLVRSIPASRADVDDLIERAWGLGELADCCQQLEEFARTLDGPESTAILGRVAESYDEDLQWAEEAARLYRELIEATRGDDRRHYRRRLAFALSRVAGSESEALKSFRKLALEEPFEPTTYRGMLDLFERSTAHDRARVAAQALRSLGCAVDREELRAKTVPSRQLDPDAIANLAMPEELQGGIFEVLMAAAPLAERVWEEQLPQRKALAGEKVRDGALHERLTDALSLFGIRKFRLTIGEAGPMKPQVFPDSTPTIWMNRDLVEGADEAVLRFWAGWSAALAWAGIGSLEQLDGRQVWHLVEGAVFKQTGRGFSDRVDALSQELGEEIGGALMTVARRRLVQAIESCKSNLDSVNCESWPELVESFATRFGLLMAGDISASLTATLAARGWHGDVTDPSAQKRVRNDRVATDILRFAMTDDYLELRHEAGLSGPPSKLEVV